MLRANPELDVLRAYSRTGGLWARSESMDQFCIPAHLGHLMWTLATSHLTLSDPEKPIGTLELSCGNGGLLA